MKKSIFLLAAAAAAFASCTQNEVMEVAENRAIGFSSFVNNNTRAVNPLDESNLNKFFVFGNYGTGTWTPVYTNVAVNGGTVGDDSEWTPEKTAYWQASHAYRFAAYSDGGNSFAGASFNADAQELTLKGYAVGDNDLIAAIPAELTSNDDPTRNDDVELSFYHMLSRVKFTFSNTDSYDYTMVISDIKVTAINQATGKYTYNAAGNTIDWTESTSTGVYDFGTLSDIAEAVNPDGSTHSVELFVIPQSNALLQVTFTATFSDNAGKIAEGTFRGQLAYSGDTSSTTDEWAPGYMYNYQVTINGSTIDPTLEQKVIKFNVDAVEGWKDDGSNMYPTIKSILNTLKASNASDFKSMDEALAVFDEFELLKHHWNSYAKSVANYSLSAFRNAVLLGQTAIASSDGEGITLSTVHTMKGQQAVVVFLVGMDEGTFPDYRAIKKGNKSIEMQQEKNNLYVAITRAQRHLYISYPEKRLMPWGNWTFRKKSSLLPQ